MVRFYSATFPTPNSFHPFAHGLQPAFAPTCWTKRRRAPLERCVCDSVMINKWFQWTYEFQLCSSSMFREKIAFQFFFLLRSRLVIIQMWIANVVVLLVKFEDLQLPSLRDFLRWLPVSFLVSGMLGTSIFALEGTTVSTVAVRKTRCNKPKRSVGQKMERNTIIL